MILTMKGGDQKPAGRVRIPHWHYLRDLVLLEFVGDRAPERRSKIVERTIAARRWPEAVRSQPARAGRSAHPTHLGQRIDRTIQQMYDDGLLDRPRGGHYILSTNGRAAARSLRGQPGVNSDGVVVGHDRVGGETRSPGKARYLLQQWTADTIRDEDRRGSHGIELTATPSNSARLLDVNPGDVIFVSGVVGGRLLPICRLVVDRTATLEELRAEGFDPYPLSHQALAAVPLPRMNLRTMADDALSLGIRKADGTTLARRRSNSGQLDGQGFRTPQWINEASAQRLTQFLDDVWREEDDSGVSDPARISRGLAPRLTTKERKAIERHAMDVVRSEYEARGYTLVDMSGDGPWDWTATHPDRDDVHVEVKGTIGRGQAVTVTAGEKRHAEEIPYAALAIVTGINLRKGRTPLATGGELTIHLDPWSVADGTWTPTVYRYEPPTPI